MFMSMHNHLSTAKVAVAERRDVRIQVTNVPGVASNLSTKKK